TPEDALQFSAIIRGPNPLAQGHESGTSFLNIGYRRKIDDRLSFVLTITDAFKSISNRDVIDVTDYNEEIDQHGRTRAIALGFTYLFGANKNKSPATFDYGN